MADENKRDELTELEATGAPTEPVAGEVAGTVDESEPMAAGAGTAAGEPADGEAQSPVAAPAAKLRKSIGREIFEWAYSIVIAILIAFLIKMFLFDIVKVDGQSMVPTLNHGDRLVVTKLGYEPQHGDIIVFDANYDNRELYFDSLAFEAGKEELSDFSKVMKGFGLPDDVKKLYYIKRVIATEGETVDIRDGKVYVNGLELEEPYFNGLTPVTDPMMRFPVTVAEDHIFVMGDNRGNSLDSRSTRVGLVDEDAILGKAQVRIYPLNNMGRTR